MTDTTTNLALPLIADSQAQKHVTHNQALDILDLLTKLVIQTRTLSAPPGSPSDGQCWIVKATGTGAWAGHNNEIAAWQSGAWVFIPPKVGWGAYLVDEATVAIWNGSNWGIASLTGAKSAFYKLDTASVVFTKTGAGTVSIKAGTVIELAGLLYTFASDTAVQMPSLTAGTDYAIYLCNDGTVRADANFSAPSGFSTTTSRQIGGFHYAPGGNATGTSGGDTTPAINAYSLWDIKWRPSCADPRGMALVAGRFWVDIYLCGVDHYANGTSRYNVTIADGSSPPKIASAFGGNGSTAYGSLTWWEATEVMQSAGKDLLTYGEFCAAAYGTTENSSGGTDPGPTILRAAYTSKWGVMLASGNLWVWGKEFGGPDAGAAWANTNGGRGQVYQQSNAALFGGGWADGANSGSRASGWHVAPSYSTTNIGARGRCDHLHHV